MIIVISGPSGVGKGTIIKGVIDQNPQLRVAISATTRSPRKHERNGKEYYFLSESEFNQKIKSNAFLEWCKVHDHQYGTLKSEVEYYLNNEYDVILEIDIQGAHKIKKAGLDVISIFIMPPTFQDLIDRLHSRNTDAKEVIEHRLLNAKKELSAIGQYDYIVVNNELNEAIKDVLEIIENTKKEKDINEGVK